MKNENENKSKIQKTNSSTSEVLENIDLTLRPTSSTEPHIVHSKSSGSKTTSNLTLTERSPNQNDVAPHITANISESALEEVIESPTIFGLNVQHSCQEQQIPNNRFEPRTLRNIAGGLINSNNAMHNEHYTRKVHAKKTCSKIPPSYSTVLKLGPPITQFDSHTSIPYIVRQPPPSYAEVHGWEENPSDASVDSFSLGPNPVYISCPRCRTIVVSDIQTERSPMAYIVSVVMCVCLCWPCCIVPFCLKSCKNTYHFCPTCNYYLGAYKPC